MSVEGNKAAARRFVEEALDKGSSEALFELFLPGAVRHFPSGDITVDSAQPAPPANRSMETRIHHLYGEGNFVTVHLTHHVTFGSSATFKTRAGLIDVSGKSVEWNAMVVLRFDGTRIAEEWVVRDELQILMQLGLVKPIAAA
jgi:hypothetical protein